MNYKADLAYNSRKGRSPAADRYNNYRKEA